jgi:phage terminase small subunit
MATGKKQGTGKDAAEERKSRFIEAYMANGGNATDAAKQAGYSERTAGQQGSRLLKDVKVASEIARRSKKVAQKYELTTELVVKTIVQELSFDPARLYGQDGQLLPITELPEDVRQALTSVEFEQHGRADAPIFVRKVKWAQRHHAREQAMKHLGMFLEDNKQKRGVEELDDAALDALIARKAKELGVQVH